MDFRQVERFIRGRFQVRDRLSPDDIVTFDPTPTQLRLIETCKTLTDQKRPLRIISVKSRRVGFSRITDAFGVCYMFAFPNFEGRLMAHFDETAIDIMSATALMAYGDGEPGKGVPWRRKREVWDPTYEYKEVVVPHSGKKGSAASRFLRASAKVRGKGRGLGFSFVHFSEAAFYPEDAPFDAVIPALAKSLDRSFAAIESTGNGQVGDGEAFYNYWLQASELNKRRDSEWVRFFVPWTEDRHCVSNQIPNDIPRDDEEKVLCQLGLTKQQIAWRRLEIATTYQGNVENFAVQNPIDWKESFLSTGQPAFAREEQDYVNRTVREPRLTAELERTREVWEVRLAPRGKQGRIKIWELPHPKNEYYIGVDLARGDDFKNQQAPPGDYAAIVVWNGSTGEQAAEFLDRIDPSQMADIVDMLARYYRTPEIAPNHCAMLNIEVNANLGAECQRLLRDKLSYPVWRFYRWRGGKDDRYNRRASTAIGWEMTMTSRKLAFAMFRNALRMRRVVVRSAELAGQICASTMTDGRWEVTHGHDDDLVAALLGWVAAEQYPPKTIITRKPDEDLVTETRAILQDQFDPLNFQLQSALARSDYLEMERLLPKKKSVDPLKGIIQPSQLGFR